MKKLKSSQLDSTGELLILPAAAESEWRLSHQFSPFPKVVTKLTIGVGFLAVLFFVYRTW